MYALRNASRRAITARSTQYAIRFSSTMHDNDPEVLEREKHRNLSGTQSRTSTPHKHAPGWNEHLASASEASVKADKDTGSPDELLQKSTIEYIQSRHSPDESHRARDEVDGPLSHAQSSESGESHPQVLVRKTVEETEIWNDDKKTASEDAVKADRGVH